MKAIININCQIWIWREIFLVKFYMKKFMKLILIVYFIVYLMFYKSFYFIFQSFVSKFISLQQILRDFWDVCNSTLTKGNWLFWAYYLILLHPLFNLFFSQNTQLMRGVMLYGVRWIGTQVTCPYLGVLRKQKFLKSFLLAEQLESYFKVGCKVFFQKPCLWAVFLRNYNTLIIGSDAHTVFHTLEPDAWLWQNP